TDNMKLLVHALKGPTSVQGMHFTDSIDLDGMTGVALRGNTVTTFTGAINLDPAPAGYAYKLYGNGTGGTQVLLNPTSPPQGAISFTDVTTNTSDTATGDDYTGPIDY